MNYALKAPMDLPVPPPRFILAALKKEYLRQARIENNTLRISWNITKTLVSTTNNLARG
jgi:hypothetical protein